MENQLKSKGNASALIPIGVFLVLYIGLGIIFIRNATTGGVDIIAKLINLKFRHLTVGRLLLIIDAFIIFGAAFVYKNIESVLFSIISIYTSSRVLDIALYGADKGRVLYIVTNSADEICYDITRILRRGVTLISAKGGYTGEERQMLFCSVRIHEVAAIYDIVDKYDPNAFIVVSEAGEIIGEGFKSIK
jgi:uncharacterized membrane-anchored protein YitT (DUF2179 family)